MLKRVFSVVTIGLSILVLLISLAGIAGNWIMNRAAAAAAQDLLVGIEKTAGAMRLGVGRVDTGVAKIGDMVTSVETATTQLGQNIADKGFVMTLLPEQKEQELVAAAQGVADTFASIRDVIAVGFGLYGAIDQSVVFLVASCVITLLPAWVVYSQVLLIRLAWAELRKPVSEGESNQPRARAACWGSSPAPPPGLYE